MKIIKDITTDIERAFYGSREIYAENCSFDGPLDGESAFKEGKNITVKDCYFNLRYPFWHCDGVKIDSSEMTSLCRAALWYSLDINIKNSKLHGIKALRECQNTNICDSDIISPEFGWLSHSVKVKNSRVSGEYFMMHATELEFENVKMSGKYSFQYIENSTFENCDFDTKDAFWHAKNVTVKNCTVKGEYLAWYCENVTFENCTLIGTQPLCYCKGLRLVNCRMENCDLSFEKSELEASVTTVIDSIKNPKSGHITAPNALEIITDEGECEITLTKRQ